MKGRKPYTRPAMTANGVYSMVNGSSIIPSLSSQELISPVSRMRKIMAKVRTRKLVQNGSTTKNSRKVRQRLATRDDVGHRIAEEQADDGAADRPGERPLQDLEIKRVEEASVMLQGEARLDPAVDPAGHEAVHQHDEERYHEESQQPEARRALPVPRPGPAAGCTARQGHAP